MGAVAVVVVVVFVAVVVVVDVVVCCCCCCCFCGCCCCCCCCCCFGCCCCFDCCCCFAEHGWAFVVTVAQVEVVLKTELGSIVAPLPSAIFSTLDVCRQPQARVLGFHPCVFFWTPFVYRNDDGRCAATITR